MWEELQEGAVPPPPPRSGSLYPLDCSKKDFRERGALAEMGRSPGAPGSHQAIPSYQLEGQLGAKKSGFPSLKDFSDMESME